MMDKFSEKWKEDKKFRAAVKLSLYVLFFVIVAIYTFTLNNDGEYINNNSQEETETNEQENVFEIPETYNYQIDVTIDDKEYEYYGTKSATETTISKVADTVTTEYLYKDNEYYIKDNDLYIKTTKEEIYDVVNYNYLNLETINSYLNKAKKENNQYLVYLKDIILGNDSDEYFVININDQNLYIDYTPLMKQFNNDIKKYKVDIKIEE